MHVKYVTIQPCFFILASLFLLTSLMGSIMGCKGNVAQQEWERGNMLVKTQMLGDAQEAYLKAIENNKEFAPAYKSLAELATKQGDSAIALQHWDEYLKRKPDDADGWTQRARLELFNNLEIPALNHAEEALKKDPKNSEAHLIAGVLTAKKGNAQVALEHLEIASAAFPKDLKVQLTYAKVLARANQLDKALEKLQAIIIKDRSHAEPYYWLGYVTSRQGKVAEAKNHLTYALSLTPNYSEAHYEMAKLLTGENKAKEALPHAQDAIKYQKHYPEAYFILAQIYQKLGKSAEATTAQADFKRESDWESRLKSLLRTYNLNTKDTETAIGLGQLLLDLDNPNTALLFFQDAATRAPQDARIIEGIKKAQAMMPKQKTPTAQEPTS
jgi:tetratricopeptide (TPR) repeat protein